MKKILLLSDTHNYLDDAILRYASEADEIWHAGDIGRIEIADRLNAIKPLKAVYGNADDHVVRSAIPLEQDFVCEGLRVWMIHIGGYPGRYPTSIKAKLTEKRPDIFICGHSHILKVIRDPSLKLLHMNPGAAGIQGFHKVRTMLRFQIHQGRISETEAIELGIKGQSAQTIS